MHGLSDTTTLIGRYIDRPGHWCHWSVIVREQRELSLARAVCLPFKDSSVELRILCVKRLTGITVVNHANPIVFFPYIFVYVFCCNSAAPRNRPLGMCHPKGQPICNWPSLPCTEEKSDSNLGLLHCSQVYYPGLPLLPLIPPFPPAFYHLLSSSEPPLPRLSPLSSLFWAPSPFSLRPLSSRFEPPLLPFEPALLSALSPFSPNESPSPSHKHCYSGAASKTILAKMEEYRVKVAS